MTKNPLALAAGVAFMLLGLGLATFLGYEFALEEKVFRSHAARVDGTLVRKERKVTRPDYGLPKGSAAAQAATTGTTGAEATTATVPVPPLRSARSTGKTTPATDADAWIDYRLHYAFTAQPAEGPTTQVTGTFEASERQFKVCTEGQSVEVWYLPQDPKGQHRAQFPIEFGTSFYFGVTALMGLCFFIAYLGWCFIYPEDEPPAESAAERKSRKRKANRE